MKTTEELKEYFSKKENRHEFYKRALKRYLTDGTYIGLCFVFSDMIVKYWQNHTPIPSWLPEFYAKKPDDRREDGLWWGTLYDSVDKLRNMRIEILQQLIEETK